MIKIENSSNLGFLYNFQNQNKNLNNEISKNKNKYIIIIYIEGSSVNVSLIYTLCGNDGNINRYETKGINWTSFGEEDFTDNFENFLLNKKIKEECFKYPSSLSKLRKSFENIKKEFYKKSQNEILISNIYKNNDLKLKVNKNDYEKSNEKLFNSIIELTFINFK